MRKRDRQTLGRIKAGHCYAHDKPVVQSEYFDGGYCSLGCKSLNVVREHHWRKLTDELKERR